MSDRVKWGKLERLYRELPTVACEGKCHTSCGPIAMSEAEVSRIVNRIGEIPYPSCIDCQFLTAANRCAIYSLRPMICRLWGVSEAMPCEHGCEVTPRPLTDAETRDYLQRSLDIGGTGVIIHPMMERG